MVTALQSHLDDVPQYPAAVMAAFLDGGYMDWMAGKDHWNFAKVLQFFEDHYATVLRTYYYHCAPLESDRSRGFHDRLEFLGMTVRLGSLQQNGDALPVQKRVDVAMGVDLVRLATKHRITHAVLITGDSDFIPAVQAAQDEGVHVHLLHGNNAHHDLRRIVDRATFIHPAWFGRYK